MWVAQAAAEHHVAQLTDIAFLDRLQGLVIRLQYHL